MIIGGIYIGLCVGIFVVTAVLCIKQRRGQR